MSKALKYYNRNKRKEQKKREQAIRKAATDFIFQKFPFSENVKERTEKTLDIK